MSKPQDTKRSAIRSYAVGYGLALVLTGLAFATVHWRLFDRGAIWPVVLALGLVQGLVHFRCFLHISLQRSTRDDLLLILFTTLIIILMASGTLVILQNLHMRMM